MGFDLFSPTLLDTKIWASFDPILEWRQNKGLKMGHNITILKNWSQKWINNLEKTTVIAFELFITVGIRYTNLAPIGRNFHFMTSERLLNFPILKKWWKIKFFTPKDIHDSKFRTFYCLVPINCLETALKNLG